LSWVKVSGVVANLMRDFKGERFCLMRALIPESALPTGEPVGGCCTGVGEVGRYGVEPLCTFIPLRKC